jgi:DNA-binding response OmpR family regulator
MDTAGALPHAHDLCKREAVGHDRPHAMGWRPNLEDAGVEQFAKVAVLVAEDEALISQMLQDALEDGGYEVFVVVSGSAAMEAVERQAATFACLVTDIRLGAGPDGWVVARRARELKADIAVVYVTADSGADHRSHGVPESILVPKPFAPDQVVTAVSTLLNKSTSI